MTGFVFNYATLKKNSWIILLKPVYWRTSWFLDMSQNVYSKKNPIDGTRHNASLPHALSVRWLYYSRKYKYYNPQYIFERLVEIYEVCWYFPLIFPFL